MEQQQCGLNSKRKMKDLKDYLHLYLGCDIDFEDEHGDIRTGKLVRVKYNHQCPAVIDCRGKRYYRNTEELQLHLRLLTDMTEEEKKAVYTIKGENAFNEFEAQSTLFLLSKHFDLFGLIESGLAIDKTKTTTSWNSNNVA
jgi:hypothetical protein